MKITIDMPVEVVNVFMTEFKSIHGEWPTRDEMQEFFDVDVPRLYKEIALEEGFFEL